MVTQQLPGQPDLIFHNSSSEEIFPNIQSTTFPSLPAFLVQLKAISSYPITCCLGEETDPHPATTSFEVVLETDKVSPEPPLLEAK